MFQAYLEVMDGLRSYYARREGDDAVAAFSAICAMSALICVNVSSLTILADVALHGYLHWVTWITSHKVLVLPIPIAIGFANYLAAKKSGIYLRRGTEASDKWKSRLIVYAISSAALLLLALSQVPRR